MAAFSMDEETARSRPQELEVARKVLDQFAVLAGIGALRQDSSRVPVEFFSELSGGDIHGAYSPKTNKAEVALSDDGLPRSPDAVLNTVVHELLHSVQFQPSARSAEDQYKATVSQSAKDSGYTLERLDQLYKDMKTAGITYGDKEPAAFQVPAHYTKGKGTPGKVLEFMQQHPEFSKLFAERNSQPNRSIPKHPAGYPDMNIFQKLLFNTTGKVFP